MLAPHPLAGALCPRARVLSGSMTRVLSAVWCAAAAWACLEYGLWRYARGGIFKIQRPFPLTLASRAARTPPHRAAFPEFGSGTRCASTHLVGGAPRRPRRSLGQAIPKKTNGILGVGLFDPRAGGARASPPPCPSPQHRLIPSGSSVSDARARRRSQRIRFFCAKLQRPGVAQQGLGKGLQAPARP